MREWRAHRPGATRRERALDEQRAVRYVRELWAAAREEERACGRAEEVARLDKSLVLCEDAEREICDRLRALDDGVDLA